MLSFRSCFGCDVWHQRYKVKNTLPGRKASTSLGELPIGYSHIRSTSTKREAILTSVGDVSSNVLMDTLSSIALTVFCAFLHIRVVKEGDIFQGKSLKDI